ncbi:hypothetical protein B7G54_21220 [Burkholderia puraquae]|uniref:Uncharacterized protein n=1 Tax=Burkholderia puraquae TaxID=1904757 RepID=A0A1X1PDP7_9BURK|nr:hypothetical protein [Burkholderia puraquae]ORT83963.1 hypothetical protein B7G54_21220 [Burkholderia puraquae]CAB3753582.1 hypothetical protein LMG29660_02129 [Burkholderia puraquae]
MSDIAIGIPFPVIVILMGAIYWPARFALALSVGSYVGVTRLRGIGRVVSVVVALLFIVDAGAGIDAPVRQGLNT